MKRFKLTIILTFMASVIFVSCDEGFAELNIDPNNPVIVPSHLLIPSTVRQYGNTSYSVFRGGGELAGWAGQLAKVQYNDQQRYVFRESVITATWEAFYFVGISDADQIYKLAEDEGNRTVMGVGKILQAYGYSMITDIYGDCPMSEAMRADEGIFTPAYDQQEAVYSQMITFLDEGIALIDEGVGIIDAVSDILYQGNIANWRKFAVSLKFRLLMRQSGKVSVGSELQAIVNSGGLFTTNDQEAKLVYLGAAPSANPMYETIVFGTRGEYKVNEVLVAALDSKSDARTSVYVQLNEDGIYRGKPSGIEGLPSDDYNYTNVSAIGEFYLRPEAPGYFVSNSEIQFLKAEAAMRGLISGSAQEFYNDGIMASFLANGLSAAEGLIHQNKNGVPLSVDNAQAMVQIGTEKWLALYCQGIEAWAEQRRTGIPDLPPAIDGVFNEIPSRLTYPTIESSINKTNYDAAVAIQGPDLLTTKLWWNQ